MLFFLNLQQVWFETQKERRKEESGEGIGGKRKKESGPEEREGKKDTPAPCSSHFTWERLTSVPSQFVTNYDNIITTIY